MESRNTIQRALVFDTVCQLQNHATADEIYDEIHKEYPHISRGTVYRNLNWLAQSGEIRKIEVAGRAEHFDHQCFDHYHIRCDKCCRIFDVDMDCIEDMEKRIHNTHGFVFSGFDIIFKGTCPNCIKQNNAKSSVSP